MPNKNIAVKSNGWDTDLDNAMKTINEVLVGGVMGFASVYNDRITVGYEPRHEENVEVIYWAWMEALYTAGAFKYYNYGIYETVMKIKMKIKDSRIQVVKDSSDGTYLVFLHLNTGILGPSNPFKVI